jgi:hypothetical protein
MPTRKSVRACISHPKHLASRASSNRAGRGGAGAGAGAGATRPEGNLVSQPTKHIFSPPTLAPSDELGAKNSWYGRDGDGMAWNGMGWHGTGSILDTRDYRDTHG